MPPPVALMAYRFRSKTLLLPGKPVAHNSGQRCLKNGLLWCIVARHFGLPGFPGKAQGPVNCRQLGSQVFLQLETALSNTLNRTGLGASRGETNPWIGPRGLRWDSPQLQDPYKRLVYRWLSPMQLLYQVGLLKEPYASSMEASQLQTTHLI